MAFNCGEKSLVCALLLYLYYYFILKYVSIVNSHTLNVTAAAIKLSLSIIKLQILVQQSGVTELR